MRFTAGLQRPAAGLPSPRTRRRQHRPGPPAPSPGSGQNPNKVETRVTLTFDVGASPSLTGEQRQRIADRLGSRITRAGLLRVTSQRHRSQAANRKAAVERFAELLADALSEDPERRPTKVPRAARRRRLENKRQRSETKRRRRTPTLPED